MRRIRFTRQGSNTIVGNFGNGDTLQCNDALARHLVEEARCAAYTDAAAVQQTPPPSKQRRRGRARQAA